MVELSTWKIRLNINYLSKRESSSMGIKGKLLWYREKKQMETSNLKQQAYKTGFKYMKMVLKCIIRNYIFKIPVLAF